MHPVGSKGCQIVTASNLAAGAQGSIPYQSAANTTLFLAGNAAATDQVVVSHGNGSSAQPIALTSAPAVSAANMFSFPAPGPVTQLPGACAVLAAPTSGINTPETSVLACTIPANTVKAGTAYRVTANGTATASSSVSGTVLVRLGTAGTSSDTWILGSTYASATSGTNIPIRLAGNHHLSERHVNGWRILPQ